MAGVRHGPAGHDREDPDEEAGTLQGGLPLVARSSSTAKDTSLSSWRRRFKSGPGYEVAPRIQRELGKPVCVQR